MRRILVAFLLAFTLAFAAKDFVRVYEDGSVGFFDLPGVGFCIPHQPCDENWRESE